MNITEDRYDGVTIDSSSLPDSVHDFQEELQVLINNLQNKKLLWVNIPIEKASFIPILTEVGFQFHHSTSNSLMLIKKLIDNPIIPTAKNYTVGVGALVIEEKKLLVVKDKFQPGYKLPGGHIDDNEMIKDALKREVQEETGIQVEFESIVNIGHFTSGQFGESNLYIVCTANALTREISIQDSSEILEAGWISIPDFLASRDVHNYNKSVVKKALSNSELKLTDRDISLRIPSGYEVFF